MRVIDILRNTIIVFFLLITMALPWLTDAKYNQDIVQYVSYYENLYNINFLTLFEKNALSFFLMKEIFFFLSTREFIYVFHNISVLFLLGVLFRYVNKTYIILVFLIFFYTIFFNQFRAAFSLALGILAIHYYKKNKRLSVFLLIISFIFHYFTAFFTIIVLFSNNVDFSKRRNKRIVFAILLMVFLFSLFLIEKWQYYFTITDYNSFFFIILGVNLFLHWDRFNENGILLKYLFLCVCLLSAIVYNRADLSARLSELALFYIFVLSENSQKNIKFDMKNKKNIAIVSIVIFFFVYRFVKVFCL